MTIDDGDRDLADGLNKEIFQKRFVSQPLDFTEPD
jgi:hypothetical protein